jgi:hypothetical protein
MHTRKKFDAASSTVANDIQDKSGPTEERGSGQLTEPFDKSPDRPKLHGL